MKKKEQENYLTVGQLKYLLKNYPDDMHVYLDGENDFGGPAYDVKIDDHGKPEKYKFLLITRYP